MTENREQFILLVDAALENRLTSKGAEQLKALALKDRDLLGYLSDMLLVHAMLDVHAREERADKKIQDDQLQASEPFPDLDELVRLAASSQSIVRPAEKSKDKIATTTARLRTLTPSKKISYRTFFLIAPCLLILLSLAIYWEFRPEKPVSAASDFDPLASVATAVDLRFPSGARPLKQGQRVATSRIRFDSGVMELKLRNGVAISMEGPVDFDLSNEMQTFCNRGRFSVTVPPGAKGFEVITPSLSVVDLGTRFVVDIDRDDRVAVHTIAGLVRIDRLPGENVQLPEGEALSLSADRRTKKDRADESLFLSETRLRELSDSWNEKTFGSFQRQIERWSTDPALLVDFDFVPKNGFMPNLARRSTETGNGKILGGRSQPGRWPQSSAYTFNRKTHGVEIEVPQTFRSLTLSMSLCIDSLDQFNHVLLASRDERSGSVLWQIRRDGTVHFGIRPDRNKGLVNYAAPRVFTPETWGAWYHLTLVLDAEKQNVVFYLDSEPIGEETIGTALPIRPGRMTVGNAFGSDEKFTDRFFGGRIDRFLLFDRALSEAEVRELARSH